MRASTSFLCFAAATAWLCASLPVFSQEAYYWTYAQHPDLAYFDHPPMVAWLIWLGTAACGDGVVGVRVATWLCGLCATWVGWRLLARFGVDEPGQQAWIALGVASPVLATTHFLTNPDPPLVCFWTLCIFSLWRARDGAIGWWLLAGAAAGAALLSKYTAAFLAVGGVVLLLADERMRRQLRRPGPWLGVLVAAIVFLPVVVWNAQHDFESFRFQTEGRLAKSDFGARHLLALLGQQIAILHPALALALACALPWLGRRASADPRVLWLCAFGLPLPAYLVFQSLWIEVKINWLAPAYVPLLLGVIVWWSEGGAAERHARLWRLARGSLWFVPLALPLAPLIRLLPQHAGSSWTGWLEIARRADALAARIDRADGTAGNVFLFAADYRDAAQLGRNLRLLWQEGSAHEVVPGAVGAPTMAQNVISIPALQFDHWTRPEDHVGQDAIFVLPRPERRGRMIDFARRHFRTVEQVERVAIRPLGISVLDVALFVCRGYRGPYERELWLRDADRQDR